MEKIEVSLPGREYGIYIGSGLMDALAQAVSNLEGCRKAALVSHASLRRKHHAAWDELAERLEEKGCSLTPVLFPAGEKHKNLGTVNRLYGQLLSLGLERSDVLIAWGGGVAGDLGGFAAASYLRGIRYFQVPTTLMAMVDSSIGGKVGVDLAQGKNLVGFFYQPAGVFCDTSLLETLPEREYVSGFGEVAKYALVFDPAFHAWLERNGDLLLGRRGKELAAAVSTCAGIKAGLVEEDERDREGRRILLNYGHTFAHALEAATAYRAFLHGEAVALGMRMAAHMAERLDIAEKGLYAAHMELLEAMGLTGLWSGKGDRRAFTGEMVERMAFDKKREGGEVRLVLLEKVGRPVTLRRMPDEEMASSILAVLEEEAGLIEERGDGR